MKQFEKAVADAPDNGSLRTKLVVSRLAVGDDAGAFKALGPALDSDPAAIKAARLIAQNELQAKRYDRVLGLPHRRTAARGQ